MAGAEGQQAEERSGAGGMKDPQQHKQDKSSPTAAPSSNEAVDISSPRGETAVQEPPCPGAPCIFCLQACSHVGNSGEHVCCSKHVDVPWHPACCVSASGCPFCPPASEDPKAHGEDQLK